MANFILQIGNTLC